MGVPEANTRATVKGEVAEGLPGSGKSVARVKRDTKELGRPRWFPDISRGR